MSDLKVFYASDIHGSEICFKKFINAGKYYGADVIIIGGDIVGKMVVPIIQLSEGSFTADVLGNQQVVSSTDKEGLEKVEWIIKNNGFYPYHVSEDEFYKIKSDKSKINEVFKEAVIESLEGWIKIADERLKNSDIKCFILPGNDDPFFIDEILSKSNVIINPDCKVIEIDNNHEMLSIGFGNMTPWNCPRDIKEEELAAKMERTISKVKNMENCIFNIHCPPHKTILDKAPELDKNLKTVTILGSTIEINVGSTAVRELIEKYQPLLSLHGHIHESRGDCKIGRTLCINAGSDYSQVILKGALIILGKKKIKSYALTSG